MDNHSPSLASAAASFLSTCGSERRPPECSTQRSPTPTPQVGQGTDDSCSGVSSFFFTRTECKNACRKTVQFGTLFELAVLHLLGRDFLVARQGQLVVQDDAAQGIVDVDLAVRVVDEVHRAEFVHEKIDSRPRGADHLRQRLLRRFGK
jgi:hypothetical protein